MNRRHALRQCAKPPEDPPVGASRNSGIAAHHSHVPGGVECERALHCDAGDILHLIFACPLVRPRTRRQDYRLPPELREIARESQSALDATASCSRWEMEGDHQEPFQETPPLAPSTMMRTVEAMLSMSSSARS